MSQETIAPAPWKLTGSGYLIFYRFEEAFVAPWIPDSLKDRWRGGIGGIGFVDYRKSDVGAYRELLFIPGRFDDGKKNRHSITQIFVSTYASVISGRANWGIPKERADFDIKMLPDGGDILTASAIDGGMIAQFHVRQGLVKLPLPSTRLCPVTISQWYEGSLYRTRFWGSGRLSLLEVESAQGDGRNFPDVSGVQPIGAFKISDFRLTFSAAKVEPAV